MLTPGHVVPAALFLVVDKARHLQGDVALVVVHGHHDIVPAAARLGKDRVRRDRPVHVDAHGTGLFDGGGDLLDLLPAEHAALAGVGVEARHSHPGLFHPQGLAGVVRDPDDGEHPVLLHPVAGLPQGDVGGDVHHAQILVGQHHGVVFGAGVVGVDLRVPGKMVARQVDGRLVQGVGDGGVDLVRPWPAG